MHVRRLPELPDADSFEVIHRALRMLCSIIGTFTNPASGLHVPWMTVCSWGVLICSVDGPDMLSVNAVRKWQHNFESWHHSKRGSIGTLMTRRKEMATMLLRVCCAISRSSHTCLNAALAVHAMINSA